MTLATVSRATLPLVAVLVALLAAVVGACSAAPPTQPPPVRSPFPPRPTPDPVAVCVNQLTYWAGVDLRGEDAEGYDYQHRGLRADQADALRTIVAEAMALGPGRAEQVVPDRVRTACARIAG